MRSQASLICCFSLVVLLGLLLLDVGVAFAPSSSSSSSCTRQDVRAVRAVTDANTNSSPLENVPSLAYDDIPSEFTPLLRTAAETCVARVVVSSQTGVAQQQHDAFRYEWGTWVDEAKLAALLERVNEVRLRPGVYALLLKLLHQAEGDADKDTTVSSAPIRYRVAGGQDWHVLLHVLPEGRAWQGRWPTGAWTILKALTGVTQVALLRGPNAQGLFRQATTKSLRGGSDGSLAGGKATAGEECIKYVGGPLRSYMGMGGKTVLLEVVIRPPILAASDDDEKDMPELPLPLAEVLSIEVPATVEDPAASDETEEREVSQTSTTSSQSTDNTSLQSKIGMKMDQVGGLDEQLNDIARRVLASRANPEAARRLGISHVKGILLSGPPGCGKTLLARELASLLGAREPQIVNGPEILDKFIGEAEKKVRALFAPAEQEYAQVGDDSALHMIILDEMDAIARKRGSMTADTTGVRDSVVNQLLAKMDGVKQASNVLVVGLTNRPELLDPALLRPGRLEVQLRIELPDRLGRRDILRIHTRQMKQAGALGSEAVDWLEDTTENGLAAHMEHYSGAEIAGVVRSAASFALARSAMGKEEENTDGVITALDLREALKEVRPALGKQDDILHMRYPQGISICSPGMERITRDLKRFTAPVSSIVPRSQSLLLVGAGGNGGAGSTALAAWAAADASANGHADYVRFITALDLLTGEGAAGDEARAAVLVDKFVEARESQTALLVLDDVDQLCAGTGPGGYSSVLLATLRALLRSPPSNTSNAKAGGESKPKDGKTGRSMQVIGATSRSDAACLSLHEIFGETLVVPLLSKKEEVSTLLSDGAFASLISDKESMADLLINRLGSIGCKTALRLAERSVATAQQVSLGTTKETTNLQISSLSEILDDLAGDQGSLDDLCSVGRL
jgi:vesicle-fusing ATPase